MNLEEIKGTFFEECSDLMSELEDGLFSLSADEPDIETINSVFRAVHSVKGGAGSFGLESLVAFAHVFESSLDVLRTDVSQTTDDRIKLLMRAADRLVDIIASAKEDSEAVDCSEITHELATEFDLNSEDEEPEEEIAYEAIPISIDEMELEENSSSNSCKISFTPLPELYLVGHDPQRLFRELAELGDCTIHCNLDQVPGLDEFNFDDTYLSWEIELETNKDEAEVRAVFEWVESSSNLSIEFVKSDEEEPAIDLDALLASLESPAEESNMEADPSGETDIPAASAPPESQQQPAVEEDSDADNEPEIEDKAPANDEKASQAKKETSKTIRVESRKVDTMINLMGELVIAQLMLTEELNLTDSNSTSTVGLALAGLHNLTREIQASVMAIRAQPIKPVFMRMSRVAREICDATGKKAKLELVGEYTEVDSTVIEGLTDPLTHMIRNAVDHGIESPELRREAGKPEQGTIVLSASHNSGRIVIEIRDDGAGINRERVLEKAKMSGVVESDAVLAENEIDELIFAAGFSTADEVTDLSGRGVGMDVVRQAIQSMGGRVSITSEPGRGSYFMLSLPLTLAILDGMVVEDAGQVFVVPISSIVETLKIAPDDLYDIGTGTQVIKLRENLVPIVEVAHEFGFAKRRDEIPGGTIVVVECGVNTLAALAVDNIVGQQQVVIKSLEKNYRMVPGIAAATILGGGKIALVLDADEIVRRKTNEITQQNLMKKSA